MCGIFGILASNCSIPPIVLEQATDSLAHRGPDDRGTVIIQANTACLEIGLGNRRLAILDLSPQGHQPMQDAETGNWIVYNGEIYNFRELRTRLQGEGVRFVSQSDTEVLLKAYGRWGEKCLGELRGMFAFAIWDAKRSRLLLGRDPMGIKPLYYCSAGQYFLFASELRTLLGTGLDSPPSGSRGLGQLPEFWIGLRSHHHDSRRIRTAGRSLRRMGKRPSEGCDVLGPRASRAGRHGRELSGGQ